MSESWSATAASPIGPPAGRGQVGWHSRSVAEVAADQGCIWHSVDRPVVDYGLTLIDDPDRIGAVVTLGLDETAFVRRGKFRRRLWSTPAGRRQPAAGRRSGA